MERDTSPVIMATEDSSPGASGTHLEVSASSHIDAHLMAKVHFEDKHHPDGARADLRGWVTLSGAHARLRIRPAGGESRGSSGERTKLVPLVASGRTVPGSATEPWHVPLHAQLAVSAWDFAGRRLAPERDAGRCCDGETGVEIPLVLRVRLTLRLDVRLDARMSPEQRGLVLTNHGELTVVDGLMLRLEFSPAMESRNGDERGRMDWPILAPGRKLNGGIRELTGISPGTWLLVRFLDGRGAALDDERVVGRCVLP